MFLLWQVVILCFFVVINGYYTIATIMALLDIPGQLALASRHHIRNMMDGSFYRPITIIVPAYNEEVTIVDSVSMMLELKYPEYEVVVVNDGSKDRTLRRLIDAFNLVSIPRPFQARLPHAPVRGEYMSLSHKNLRVIDKDNGGKADALNAGINASLFPIFCSVDADSVLDGDALMRAAKLFVEDRKVIATGGIIRVLNGCTVSNGKLAEVHAPKRWIERFQSIEYIRGFLAGRTSWNVFNGLLIISGAFGIFRKDIVTAIGGYRKTVGEDMDLVVRMHRHCRKENIPYRIQFVPDPVCWTQVPGDWRSLLIQRNRWHRGLIDSLWYNRSMFLNPRYGWVGLFAFPYFFFMETLGPVIEFLGYAGFVFFFFMEMVNYEFGMLFLIVAVIWGIWLNLGALILDNLIFRRYDSLKDLLILSLFGFLEFLGYRQLISVERLIATGLFWRTNWGKPKRMEITNEK
jgi:cellulose synthase/poly-beta-1,6-N-acetylglucosamine synthase-like glycosyltransferase